MKTFLKSGRSSLILSAIVLISSCSQSPDYKKREQEVRDLHVYSVELFNKKDVEKLTARFTEDGSIKISGAPLITGREALKTNYENTVKLQDFNISLDVKKVEISKCGDMAYAMSEYNVSFDVPNNHIIDEGITVLILKRVNDSWKIVAENLSAYPPEK